MKTIRICHLTSAHNSTDTRIFEKECTSLAKLPDCEVFLVAKGGSYDKNNVHVVGLGESPTGRFDRMFSFSKQVVHKSLEINADIYHLHDPELLQYVGDYKKKKKLVVFDSHEDVADSILDKAYLPKFTRKPIANLYKFYSEKQLAKCDALISVTPHIVDKLKLINNNTYMITNYPIIVANSPDLGYVPKLPMKTIIFAGGVDPQWSHDLIIDTINDLNIAYELYGSADEQYLNCLKKIQGWKKTHFYGQVSFQKVQEALYCADIAVALLQPSHNTGGLLGTIGNTKLFECMNAGLPVICTNFTLWKDIVEKFECGICVNPSSREQLHDAISFLIQNPKQAARMGINGKMIVAEKFNWKTQEEELYKLYRFLFNKL